MSKTIDFYFDFMSPFAYLAHHRLLSKRDEYDYQLAYHPLDLAYVKIKAGNTGPSNRSIPAKISFTSFQHSTKGRAISAPVRRSLLVCCACMVCF